MAVRPDGGVANLTREQKQVMPQHSAIEMIRERQEDICRDMWG
jgi:hypothetical protein